MTMGPSEGGSPDVTNYRLGEIEKDLTTLLSKLDSLPKDFVTQQTLNLVIRPIKDDIRDIQAERRTEAAAKGRENEQKKQQESQFKIAIIAAGVSPIVSIVLTILLTGKLG